MKRRLLPILSALSLLLCVVVCALWVRSFWVCDYVHHGTGVMAEGTAARVRGRWAYSYRGRILLGRLEMYAVWGGIRSPLPAGWLHESFINPDFLRCDTPGFKLASGRVPVQGNGYHDFASLTFPHGVLMLLLAALPAWWVVGGGLVAPSPAR